MSTWCEKSLFFLKKFFADTTVLNELRRTGAVKNESRTQSHFASNICFLDLVTGRSDVLNHHKSSQPESVQHQAKSLQACEARGSSGCCKAAHSIK